MIYQQVDIIQYSLRDLTITKNKIVFYHQSYQHVDTWSNTWLITFLEKLYCLIASMQIDFVEKNNDYCYNYHLHCCC